LAGIEQNPCRIVTFGPIVARLLGNATLFPGEHAGVRSGVLKKRELW
jgi:hypothetical protein